MNTTHQKFESTRLRDSSELGVPLRSLEGVGPRLGPRASVWTWVLTGLACQHWHALQCWQLLLHQALRRKLTIENHWDSTGIGSGYTGSAVYNSVYAHSPTDYGSGGWGFDSLPVCHLLYLRGSWSPMHDDRRASKGLL